MKKSNLITALVLAAMMTTVYTAPAHADHRPTPFGKTNHGLKPTPFGHPNSIKEAVTPGETIPVPHPRKAI